MFERIGPYRVEGELGRGGMGVVYRAVDPRLDRAVAIKALPEHLAADPERLARFEAEAKTLATLSHPNVAGIYGVEEQDGHRFLVLEFVDGDTLGEVIARGPLPLDQVLDIAIQIAAGVSAAHGAGVIHRDLKPANVKITPDDKVKVLDFGLAKSTEGAGDGPSLADSPTMTRATQAGVILGTAGYMAPEQARGKAVDKRADVFAFGCLLYEMLTGDRSFGGDTVPDALGAVLHLEPDWAKLPEGTSPRLRRLLERCLAKDREQRLHDVADARLELEDIRASGPTAPQPSATVRKRSPWPIVGAFAAGIALAGVLLWQIAPESSQTSQPVRRFELSGIGMPIDAFQGIVLSPDGSKLVVRARGADGAEALKVRSFDAFELEDLPGSESGWLPFFSPDGTKLGFFSLGELKTTTLGGGLARTIAATDRGFSGGVWLNDDTILFTGAFDNRLYRVPADGGEIEMIDVEGTDGIEVMASPSRLPGDRGILLSVRRGAQFDIAVLDLADRTLRIIADNGFTPHWAASGHVVYQQGTNGPLVALPFDADRLEPTGPAFPTVDGVGARVSFQVQMFSIAADGALAFIPQARTPDDATLVWMDAEGREIPVTIVERVADSPRLSHDGTRVAFRTPAPNCDIWVHDLVRGTTTRITREGDNHGMAWSPDDRLIATARHEQPGLWSAYTMSSDGAGKAERVSDAAIPDGFMADYAGDGVHLLTGSRSGGTTADIQLVSIKDGSVRPLFDSRFDEQGATLSPDGKFIVYSSNESGREEVYVQPFPELDTRTQVSTNGGNEPLWSRDGKKLYFRVGRRLFVVDVTTTPVFSVGRPTQVLEGDFAKGSFGLPGYDVSADGKRFLVFRERYGAGVVEVKVILNWFEELAAMGATP